MGRARAGQPRTATLSPPPARRLSLILHSLADRTHAHGANVIAEEAAAAFDAPLPANDPDHPGRMWSTSSTRSRRLPPSSGQGSGSTNPCTLGFGRWSGAASATALTVAVSPLGADLDGPPRGLGQDREAVAVEADQEGPCPLRQRHLVPRGHREPAETGTRRPRGGHRQTGAWPAWLSRPVQNAAMPVMARPRIRACTSCAPS